MTPRILALFFCLFASTSFGDVIRYSLALQTGKQPFTLASFVDPLATADALDRGSGVTAVPGSNSINSNGWSTGALNSTDYYEFEITSAPSTIMTLSKLDFRERRSATGIRNFMVRTSTDGFATFFTQHVASVPDDIASRDHSVNLLGLSALSGGTNVRFRFYGFAAESGTGTWRLEDYGGLPTQGIRLQGLILSVPEPTSAAMLYLATSGLAMFRRRRP